MVKSSKDTRWIGADISLVKKIVIILLLLIAISSISFAGDRDIYIAGEWMDYLRLIPLSTHGNYLPIVYSENGQITPPLLKFGELFGGTTVFCTSDTIDNLNRETWPIAETIVVSTDDMQLGTYAASIAAALDAPLYFDLFSEKTARSLGVERVILIGGELIPAANTVIHLKTLEQTRRYYESLIDNCKMSVLADSTDRFFIAAAVAASHHCPILQSPEEIKKYRPRYLAWVTDPEAVTIQNVKRLYRSCRFAPGVQTYDIGVGIVTGFNLHDMSLLLSRTYTYARLEGEWKGQGLIGSFKGLRQDTIYNDCGHYILSLQGQALTGPRFTDDITRSGYVFLCAHGSPNGFNLEGKRWPSGKIPALPPLVFVAEACETGNITGMGVRNSIALKLISAGAVAYIGSMGVGGVAMIGDYPFMRGTPNLPLSEEVRLQNAGRLDVDADWPRVILIGEPTFHQFEHNLYTTEYSKEKGRPIVRVMGHVDTMSTNIAIDLPDDITVAYAVADINHGKTHSYSRGPIYQKSLMSIAGTYDRQVLLLQWPGGDGIITLHDRKPLGVALMAILATTVTGVRGMLIDLTTISPALSWFLIILGLAVLVIVQFRGENLTAARKWIALLTGLFMTILVIMTLGLNQSTLMGVILVSIGAITVTILVPSEQVRLWHTLKAMVIFALPMFFAWLLINSSDVSSKATVLIGYGMCLIVLCYGLVLLLAGLAYRVGFRLYRGKAR